MALGITQHPAGSTVIIGRLAIGIGTHMPCLERPIISSLSGVKFRGHRIA
jgi:hypothetical protein